MAGTRLGSTSTLSGIAKELYPDSEIKKLEQLHTAFKKEVEEDTKLNYSSASNGTFKFAVKAYGPHGQKMMNESEALPTARAGNFVQGTSSLKEYAGVLQFTKREMALAQGDPESFADAKTLEMECLIENAQKYFNRQMANGIGTGQITLVNGAQVADTTIEVDDATSFQIGMVIDIFDAAGTVKQADGIVVTNVDFLSATNTITVDTATTCDDNGIIVIAGVKDNAATDGKEMIGLPLCIDDGTLAAAFQGITRSTTPNYKGITLNAAAAPISVSLINQLMTRAYRIGQVDFFKDNSSYFLMSPEQWRAYTALSIPQVQFMPSDSPDGNKPISQFSIAGKRVVIDTDVDRTRVYLIKKDAIKLAVAEKLDWEDELGGTDVKWLSGTTQAVLVLYGLQQMYCVNPRELAGLTNLATVSI